MHEGKRIRIPMIEEEGHKFKKFAKINSELYGRPTTVLKRLVGMGFDKKWWNDAVLADIILYCKDKEYIKRDAPILSSFSRIMFEDIKRDFLKIKGR